LSLVAMVCVTFSQANAQTVLNSTTLAGALSATSSTLALNSATGVTAPGPNQSNLTVLVVEREVILVQSVSGTIVNVTRGQYGSGRVPHANGVTVWVAPDKALERGAIPSGSCTRTNVPYVPIVYVAPTAQNSGRTGDTFDCMGGQIVQTNLPVSYKGSDVASATSITPTGTFFIVSGTTNPVSTIVLPAGWAPGNCLGIEPTGAFVTGVTDNIGKASTGVVGKILFECWDGAKWWPSY
jgi:hypothetical protein